AVRPEQDALVPRGAQGELRRAGRGGGLMLRRNKRGAYWLVAIAAAAGAAGTAGCRGQTSSQPPIVPLRNMFDQDRYDAQEESEFFADGRTMRTPVAGTIPRERELDPQLAEGRLPDDSGYVAEVPKAMIDRLGGATAAMERGQERYNIY